MKTRSWTRVLSTLLTVAMIATLLVVPASAVGSNLALFTAADTMSNSMYTAVAGLGSTVSYSITLSDGSTQAVTQRGQLKSGKYITFTAPADGTLIVYANKVSSDRLAKLSNTTDGTDSSLTVGTANLLNNKYHKVEFTGLVKDKAYKLERGGSDQVDVVALEFVSSATYKATVASNITGGTVKLQVGEAAAAAEVEVAEGTVVNIVTEPAENNKLTANSIKVTKDDNSQVTLEADGKSFKMPAGAVTVTAAFEADTRDESAIVAEVVAAVKTALSGKTSVAQATANTADDAKTWVEGLIANVDDQGCTVSVAISSDFSAATAGTEATPAGENGQFKYTVTVSKGGASDSTATNTVTITATPKTYVRQDAKDALAALRTEMAKYGAGTVETVFADKIVIPEAAMKILTDAVVLVAPADADGKTSDVYKKATTDAATALANFETAIADVDKNVKGTRTDAGLKVLTGDLVQAGTTPAGFTITDAPADPSGAGIFADGYEGAYRLKMGNNGAIKFTVAEGTTADLRVYWVCNDNANGVTLTPPTNGSTGTAGGQSSGVTKNTSAIATWSGLAAGEYTIKGKQYIFRVEVKETAPDRSAAPAFAPNGDTCQMDSKNDATVTFQLSAAPAADTVYKLYEAATAGTQLGQNAGVTADSENKITFTLTAGQIPTGTADKTWYVSATETDKGESARTAVTVKPYIPVTKVELTHFTATEPGSGSEVAGTVKHVLYEKLKSTDADVIGTAENESVKYPNGWVLKAVVTPENATNKNVVFSNARGEDVCIHVEEDGTVTAIKAGTGRVRVSSVGDPDVAAAFDLTVKVRIGAVEIQNADGTAAATTVTMGKTLPLKAVVTASASASQSHQEVEWTSSNEAVATVSAAGVVTPVKPGEVKITATSKQDESVKDELTLTVSKGTPALTFTTGNPQVTSGGKVRFKLSGVEGMTPTFTVKQGNDTKDVTVYELDNDTDYNYYADMPENTTGATVTYTVTAKVDGNDSWNAAEKSVEVKVLDVNAKNIYIVSPGTAKDVELARGGSAKLEVIAQVNKAGGVKDDAATAALTYKWTKDGEAMSDTTYAITVDTAGVYVCTVTSADEKVETKEVIVTFTVTETAVTLTAIDVTPATGVDYTAATGALKITGPVDATFTVTTTPAEGHGDTLVAVSSTPSVARVSLVDGKLTVTPWSVGETTVTVRGTAAADVKKEIKVTVVKAAAPAALTADDYTVTQPTVAGGKGTIKITQNAPEGTEYVYRKGDSGAWIKFPANKTIEVEPGVYKIRVYVPKPELQETTNGVAVEIKDFTTAPTVASVVVTSTADSLEVGKTLQLAAQVHMSNNTVSATETVTWTTSDESVATVSATGLVTGVKAGTVTITATSATDNTKKGTKTLTVTAKQDPGQPVDKTALNAAIADAEKLAADTYTVADDTKVSQVDRGTKFVTDSDQAALAAAIADAKAVAANADATEADVAAAVKALADAVKTFNDAIQTGTKRNGGLSPNPGTRPGGSTGTVTSSVTNPAGGKTTVKKDHEGNVTITATDDKGEVIAEVKLPATIPSVGYKFVDVPEGHWAEKAINEMAGLELVKGVDEAQHLFDMTSPITRGAVATILGRLANGKADVGDTFSDVTEGQWFAEGVAWAAKAGVVTGFEDGTFGPDGAITREQLAVMIARYAKLLGLDTTASTGELAVFTDADSIQTWALEGMAWCVKAGIVQGRGDNTVDPGANATRAEATMMLNRLVNLMK